MHEIYNHNIKGQRDEKPTGNANDIKVRRRQARHKEIDKARKATHEVFKEIGELIRGLIWGTIKLFWVLPMTVLHDVLFCEIVAFLLFITCIAVLAVVDAIIFIFNNFTSLLISVSNLIMSAVDSVSNSMSSVSTFFGGSGWSPPTWSPPNVYEFLGSWLQTLAETETTCDDMDTWYKVLQAFVTILGSDSICPFLRYMLAVPPLYAIFYPMLFWVSYDPTQNCQAPDGETLCMILRLYLLIYDFIIPIIFFRVFMECYRDPILIILRWVKDLIVFIFRILDKVWHFL